MGHELLRWFEASHLTDDLRVVSEACGRLAAEMDAVLDEGREKTAGLRKLLEAKDCFVRARIDTSARIDNEHEGR